MVRVLGHVVRVLRHVVRVLGHVVRVLGNVVWGIRSRGQGTVLGHEVRVLGNMVRVKVQVVSVPAPNLAHGST